MPDAPALQSQAERLAALVDGLTASFAHELQDVLRETNRRLARWVREALDPKATGKRTLRARIALAVARRDEIRRVLTAAGYDDLASSAVVRGLDAILRTPTAREVLAAATQAVQRVEVLEGLRAGQLELLLGEGDVVAGRIYQAVMRGIVTQAERDELLDGIAAALQKADTDVRTLYDTATSIFTRQAAVLEAGEDAAFLYVGPVDVRNRPFCEEHVGKVYTRDRIAAMDNGQLPNCLLTGGGYNCRHIWEPLSAWSDYRSYVNTGERLPEFAELLRTRPAITRYGKVAA